MSTLLSPLAPRAQRTEPDWDVTCEDENYVLRAELHRADTRVRKSYRAQKEAEERAEQLHEVALGFQMLAIDLFQKLPPEEWPDGAFRRFGQLVDDRVALQPDE